MSRIERKLRLDRAKWCKGSLVKNGNCCAVGGYLLSLDVCQEALQGCGGDDDVGEFFDSLPSEEQGGTLFEGYDGDLNEVDWYGPTDLARAIFKASDEREEHEVVRLFGGIGVNVEYVGEYVKDSKR